MAEEFVVFEKVVERLIDPIIHQFSYLFFYKSNIKSLTNGVEDLQNKKSDVTLSVDAQNRNLQIIGRDVESWLVKVEENEKASREVLEETKIVSNGCLNGWCPNLKQRYVVSRKAVKQLAVVKELLTNGEKFTQTAYPALPAGMMASISNLPREKFESRISLTKDVIEALKNENFSMIGVCGLGGVGKTTMAKEIRDIAIAENLCNEVAMAVVTENPNLKMIQDELASMLGLELEERNITDVRGKRLRERLMKGRTLVILDDVWKNLNLEELGIPVGGRVESKGCKVLITSRSVHVCNAMGTNTNFAVNILSNTEAWDLFKEKAGILEETGDLYLIAKKVSEECGRLPLAIVTVGTALKGKEEDDWKDALYQLQRSNITSILGMENDVYARLRLSYKLLENNQLRRLFLLCCTYPEDHDIPVEELVRYSVGLRLFEDVSHMENIRRRVNSLVNQLKSCYLLLDSDKPSDVKVHDVLRDFGLQEASQGEHVYLVKHQEELEECMQNDLVERCTEISISSDGEFALPPGLVCPSLKRLTLSTKGSIQISTNYFGGMKGLCVVSFRGQHISFNYEDMFLDSPLKPLRFFMNVKTLCLENCRFNNTDVRFIGSMQKLEILSLIGSEYIDVLPYEIGQLVNLKVFDLRRCGVRLIPPGVLSSLKKLEDLYMGDYFYREGIEECNQGNCAKIIELYTLSALRTLQVSTYESEASIKLKEFLFDQLILFDISINMKRFTGNHMRVTSNRTAILNSDLSHFVGDKAKSIFRMAKVLHIQNVSGWKNVIGESDEVAFTNLKELILNGVNDLGEIFHGSLHPGLLQMVKLANLSAMTNLWSTQVHPSSFENLKYFKMEGCNAIHSLFSPSVVSCLLQLQYLNISNCEMLESIVSKDEAENDELIEFLNLRRLKLSQLPSLKNFIPILNSSESLFKERISLPSMRILKLKSMNAIKIVVDSTKRLQNLDTISVKSCRSIETVFDLEEIQLKVQDGSEEAIFGQLRLIKVKDLDGLGYVWRNFSKQGFIQRASFSRLEKLVVYKCHNLRCIFSPSIAKLLVNLHVIKIRDCVKMEQVMLFEEEESLEIEKETIVFPKLRKLDMRHLPSLKKFVTFDHSHNESLLNEIISLPSMKTLFLDNMIAIKMVVDQLQTSSSIGNLRLMNVQNCDELTCISTTFDATKLLQNLDSITINACRSIETVFDLEGAELSVKHDSEEVILGQLQSIKVKDLGELRYIWRNFPKQGLIHHNSFQKLEKLKVYRCNKLRYIFSANMAKLLVNLQVIKIKSCEMIEQVILFEEEEESHVTEKKIIELPKLSKMDLRQLPSMKNFVTFSNGSNHNRNESLFEEGISLPSMETLWLENMNAIKIVVDQIQTGSSIRKLRFMNVEDCHELFCISATFDDTKVLQNLETLCVESCRSIETVFDLEGLEDSCEEVILGQLQSIKVKDLPELRYLWRNLPKQGLMQRNSFSKLNKLVVNGCDKLRYIFSDSMTKLLVNLEVINIEDCKSIGQVILFEDEEGIEIENKMTEFPKLTELSLSQLPSMVKFVTYSNGADHSPIVSLFKEGISLPSLEYLNLKHMNVVEIVNDQLQTVSLFHNLKYMYVGYCHELSCISPTFDSTKLLQSLETITVESCRSLETVFDLEGIECAEEEILGQLKDLYVGSMTMLTHICRNFPSRRLIQSSSFSKLKYFKVYDCTELRYILSPSIAKLLVNLYILGVSSCSTMEQVMITEEEEIFEIDKKMDTIVFPKLEALYLDSLENLTSFYEGSHDLEFPSLNHVILDRCPSMDNFCSKSEVRAPKVDLIYRGDLPHVWMGDLNKTIQHIKQRHVEE